MSAVTLSGLKHISNHLPKSSKRQKLVLSQIALLSGLGENFMDSSSEDEMHSLPGVAAAAPASAAAAVAPAGTSGSGEASSGSGNGGASSV